LWIRFFLANSRTALGLPPKLSAEITISRDVTQVEGRQDRAKGT
jgi:hypothetical protein